MTDGVSADYSEMHKLIADLSASTKGLLPKVDAVVKKGADNVKKDLNGQARHSTHFNAMDGSITYDSNYRLGLVQYEVGPDKRRRGGALGNIFFFGGANGGGGTGDLDGAMRTEEPHMVKALGDLLGGVL